MSDEYSEWFREKMIVIFANPYTGTIRSYNLGTKAIIIDKPGIRKFKYGYPLLMYIATALTIKKCKKESIPGLIFTIDTVARWLDEGSCGSKMLDSSIELNKEVSKLTSEIHSKPLPEIRIWNEAKWGNVSVDVNGNCSFEIDPGDILKFVSYQDERKLKKKKKKKDNDGGVNFPALDW